MRVNRSRSAAGPHGFSLFELMVVLALIGILTSLIVAEMRGSFQDALLRSTGRDLVNVFSLASSRAVTLNHLHRVRLARQSGRYVLEQRVRHSTGEAAFVPVRDGAGGQGKLDTRISVELHRRGEEPPEESEPSSRPFDGGVERSGSGEAITFYPDGTAEAGEVVLRDSDGFGLALRINPTTARVRVVELERK
jgi:type II secretion system protein H